MSEVIWLPVVGWPYEVSSSGLVRRDPAKLGNTSVPNGLIAQRVSNAGYLRVCLCHQGRQHYASVHRMVAAAFIPNPHAYPCVNHKDGNKRNNAVRNLEWCTRSQNDKHAYAHGLRRSPFARIISHNGVSTNLGAWATSLGIDRHTLSTRIARFGITKALSQT